MDIKENIDNYNVIKKQLDKIMIRNKVFEENDACVRKTTNLSKGDWEHMTLSVSIYDYIMTILPIYIIVSVILYFLKGTVINYLSYGILIISALLYIACMLLRYDTVLKWKTKYIGKTYIKYVAIFIEVIVALLLVATDLSRLYVDDNELFATFCLVIGVSLIIIAVSILFLYKNPRAKHTLKITILKGSLDEEEKEEYKDDILIDGGITFMLKNNKSRAINFEKENVYLNSRKDLIIYKGDDLKFDGNRGAILINAAEIDELVLKTIKGIEKRQKYTDCFK